MKKWKERSVSYTSNVTRKNYLPFLWVFIENQINYWGKGDVDIIMKRPFSEDNRENVKRLRNIGNSML